MGMAHNRRRPRARTWTLEDLDRGEEYLLYFDPVAFRWEVVGDAGVPVVTRVAINRRSAWEGDRRGAERIAGAAAEATESRAGPASTAPGRHRSTH